MHYFFVENFNAVTGLSLPFLHLALPIGISFYTFQALGYSIDVYRGTISHEKSFLNYALFVSFFPQLVAGPIERSGNLLADIHDIPNKKLWDYDRITRGLTLMLYGMFIAIVVPQAREEKPLLLSMVLALVFSCLFSWVPVLKEVSAGLAIVICTVAAAAICALVYPEEEEVAE